MIPLNGDSLPTLMLAAGIALLTSVLLRLTIKRRRRASGRSDLRQLTEQFTERKNAENELVRRQVEMHELVREWKAELDSKMHALQLLILDAQRQQQRLEQLLDELRAAEQRFRK